MINRFEFAPEEFRVQALADREMAIPIQDGVTLPGESVTALMTQLIDVKPGDKVLLIGTGSGYQTAYIAEKTGACVDSLDIRLVMNREMEDRLPETVRLYRMDGFMETPQDEVYDAVVVTCSSPSVMAVWADCLVEGGRLVAPIGNRENQALRKYVKTGTNMDDVGDFAYLKFIEGDVILNGKTVSIFDMEMKRKKY